MTPIIFALVLAVAALVWCGLHLPPTNHAENDEATLRGGVTHERKNHEH